MKFYLFFLCVLFLNSGSGAESTSVHNEDFATVNEQYELLYAVVGSDPSEEDTLILELIAKSAFLAALESSHDINSALGLEYLPYNEQRYVAVLSGVAGFYLTTKGLRIVKRGVNFVGLSREYRRYRDLIYRMQDLNKQINKLSGNIQKREYKQHKRSLKLERKSRQLGLETPNTAEKTSVWRRMIPFGGSKTVVPEIPNRLINQLSISQATIKALKNGGILTYKDLSLMTKADLASVPGLDSKKINIISTAFNEEGFHLAEDAVSNGTSKAGNGFIESEKLTQLKNHQLELENLRKEFQLNLAQSRSTGWRRVGRGFLRNAGLTAIGIAGVYAYTTVATNTFVILAESAEGLERIRDRYHQDVYELSVALGL